MWKGLRQVPHCGCFQSLNAQTENWTLSLPEKGVGWQRNILSEVETIEIEFVYSCPASPFNINTAAERRQSEYQKWPKFRVGPNPKEGL